MKIALLHDIDHILAKLCRIVACVENICRKRRSDGLMKAPLLRHGALTLWIMAAETKVGYYELLDTINSETVCRAFGKVFARCPKDQMPMRQRC